MLPLLLPGLLRYDVMEGKTLLTIYGAAPAGKCD